MQGIAPQKLLLEYTLDKSTWTVRRDCVGGFNWEGKGGLMSVSCTDGRVRVHADSNISFITSAVIWTDNNDIGEHVNGWLFYAVKSTALLRRASRDFWQTRPAIHPTAYRIRIVTRLPSHHYTSCLTVHRRNLAVALCSQLHERFTAHLDSCIIMQPSITDRIKHCTSSVCPSVCPVLTIYSKSESRRNFKFDGDMTLETRNQGRKLQVKRSKVKVT